MNKWGTFFKRAIKITVGLALGFVFVFVLVALLIQIPVVQNKIVDLATSFVSSKTQTQVVIENVNISFPKAIVLSGIFLEDSHSDTLIYARKTKVNIALWGLLSKNIQLSSFALENATIRLYNTQSDPLFNYHFLIAAFGDSTKKPVEKNTNPSKWTFSIDKIELSEVQFSYNDLYGGMRVFAAINKSQATVGEISPENSIFVFHKLLLSGINLDVQATDGGNKSTQTPENILPHFYAEKLKIIDSSVNYTDSSNYLSVNAIIDQLLLTDASLDIQKEILDFNQLIISNSDVRYHNFEPEGISGSLPKDSLSSTGNNWKVALNQLNIVDSRLKYQVGAVATAKNEFNPSLLVFNQLTLAATDFYYDKDLVQIAVEEFKAKDLNGFVINSLKTNFSMDATSITADNLKLKTPNSSIDADFYIQYSSLESFTSKYDFSNMHLEVRGIDFKNQDALYFSNQLINQPFFADPNNTTFLSGTVSGPMNNLAGKDIVLRTGERTVVRTDFIIAGLPEAKTATYNFPNLRVTSGNSDLKMVAGSAIPKNIELPETLDVSIAFGGKITEFESTLSLTSSFGSVSCDAMIDKEEHFSVTLGIHHFDLGRLLNDTLLYGPVSLNIVASGKGLDKETVTADIYGKITEFQLNRYIYKNLNLDGSLFGQEFSGNINLNDENAVFDFNGLVGINPGNEFYKFKLVVSGADLQKLHISKEDIRVELVANANIEGRAIDQLFGKVSIENLTLVKDEKVYSIDSLIFTSANTLINSEFEISSPLVDAKYTGNISPVEISVEFKHLINHYFPEFDEVIAAPQKKPADFTFKVQLHNHPIISDILFPQLSVFQPGTIEGSYRSEKQELKLHALMHKIVYGNINIDNLILEAKSDSSKFEWSVSSIEVSNNLAKLENFLFDGTLANSTFVAGLSSIDDQKRKKFAIESQIKKHEENFRLAFNTKDFYLMYSPWEIDPENFIEFGDKGLLIHNLFLNNATSKVNVSSVNEQFNGDLRIELQNLNLDEISRVIEKDTGFVKGTVNGNAIFKRSNDTFGIIADAEIVNLIIRDVPVGDLVINATNPEIGRFDVALSLLGAENNLTAKGHYIPDESDNTLTVNTTIESLSMKTIEAFSMGQISESSGNMSGDLLIQGSIGSPFITGNLVFNDVYVKPAVLNNLLHLRHETIQLKQDGIYFSAFTVSDSDQNSATIDGSVLIKNLGDFVFALQVNANDFLLINTTSNDNENFYGRMVIDSRLSISGPSILPEIGGRLRVKRGSHFTFVVPEERLTKDRGEDVIDFMSPKTLGSILSRVKIPEGPKSNITGFDLSTIIEIDKQATLRLLMDPTSSDSLVVRGDAALSFSIDRSGKISLTGAYHLDEGSYMVSLESMAKRNFEILAGSTIIWNGDPLDAAISIDARYTVRAAPYDLVAFQMSGLTAAESGSYKQQFPFWVLLKLRGDILQPDISFEIQLPPDEKGILGGAVNQKLNLLNQDESALNKQVFALLVLGRFIQENPLQTASGGTSTLVRSTVGKFLSAQLNQLTSTVLPGMELNFDIQSYEDYQTGQAEGRTQVEIGLKQQLFNERLSVQLGGSFDVEGERANQNQATDIASDIKIEYKLTKDGRYRLKGFRHNLYEGAIEGQLVETGFGIAYVRDFNRLKTIFSKRRNKNNFTVSEELQ